MSYTLLESWNHTDILFIQSLRIFGHIDLFAVAMAA